MTNITTFRDLDEIFTRYCRDKEMIDIGGMSGNVDNVFPLEKLQKFAKSILCVDANRNELINLGKAEFVQSKIEDFNTDKRFDVAFCGEIIEHIANQETFLLKVKSLLAEGGKAIFTTPNSTAMSDIYRIIKLGRDPRQDEIMERMNGVYFSGHVVIHNIATLQQLFDSVGMTITDVYYRRPVGQNIFKQWLRDAILMWRPQFSSQIVVVAERSSVN